MTGRPQVARAAAGGSVAKRLTPYLDQSETPDAVRMRRPRAHVAGDHRACLPSQCQLAYAELRLLRALLEQQPTETSVRFARRERTG